jgi:ribosomal protein S18 acetylase RimI-like enzyme
MSTINWCTIVHPHVYVAMLGVAETAQGKGIGRKALEIAIKAAGDMPIYLECHNENVP